MTAFVELYIDQGASFNNVINITDDLTNGAINISGYTAVSQIRRSHYSANISANITCTITGASNGELTMSMTSANTANLKAGRYVFDLKVTDVNNVTSRILEGIVNVTPQVSK